MDRRQYIWSYVAAKLFAGAKSKKLKNATQSAVATGLPYFAL
jgi:hypothetical protein